MKGKISIPPVKLSGDDSIRQKQEELKRKLQNAQANNSNTNAPAKKKVKWGRLFLGIIGLIAGAFLMVQSSGTGAALVMVIAIIAFCAIYAAIKNK